MGAPEDEARIAAIVAEGRALRRRPSRSLWIAAAIVGAVCAIGFALGARRRGAGAQEDAGHSSRRSP